LHFLSVKKEYDVVGKEYLEIQRSFSKIRIKRVEARNSKV
jgi:hypothetical protein